jgi:hypothetical protein
MPLKPDCRPRLARHQDLRLATGRVGVVVDVGFPQVLRLGADVRLVIVFDSWMIVLVGMKGRHVLPLAAVPEIVHHVSVLMGMNDRVMGVLHDLPLVTLLWVREPARGARRAGLAMAAPATLARQPPATGTSAPAPTRAILAA